ncbi:MULTISPECIES: PEF-CTERM sorting domain-containing protein [unclassified Methanosarcina]|nr:MULTISPECIES: PEF-CTERM sorting domain-containing protein [unclassified Methanosarcina]
MPINAGEVSVTFDEGHLCTGQEIGNNYLNLGIIFSPGVKLVDIGFLHSKKDMGFWNPDNRTIQIYFSPAVSSVSIDFKDAYSGNMEALLVNGKVLSKSEYNCVWNSKKTLKIESNNVNIKSISISGKSPYSKKIKFDNLCYKQFPEASENSSYRNDSKPNNNYPDVPENPLCGNDSKSDDTCPDVPESPSFGNNAKSDNTSPDVPENPSCGNDSKSDNNYPEIPENSSCENNTKPDNNYPEIPEIPENSSCENNTKPDNNYPEIPENSSCENDTKPDDNCPDVPENPSCENNTKPDNPCNQQIPEYPTIAIPMIAVIGMLFIFQRRKN